MVVGSLVALYISLLAPVSGMSLNPARTFGSSVVAHLRSSGWIYWTAPPFGMPLAAEAWVRGRGRARRGCAKFCHLDRDPCIFCAARERA